MKISKMLLAVAVPLCYFAAQLLVAIPFVVAVMLPHAQEIADLSLANDQAGLAALLADIMAETAKYSLTITILSGLLFLGVIFVVFFARKQHILTYVLADKVPKMPMLTAALLAGIGANALTTVLIYALPLPQDVMDQYEQIMNIAFSGNIFVVLFATVILAPFVEELIFRGFSQRLLMSAMPPMMAVVAQAMIFALSHGQTVQSAYTFAAGLAMGLLYLWSGNLWVSIGFHFAYNGFSFVLDGIISGGYGESDPGNLVFAVIAALGGVLLLFGLKTAYGLRAVAAENVVGE